MGDQNGAYGQGYARGNATVGQTQRPSISELVGCTPGRKKCACALSLYGIPWLVAAIVLFILHLAKGNKDSFYLHIATYLFILSVLVLSPPLVMGCLAYRRYRLVKRSRQLADTGTYQANLPSIVHPMTTTTRVPNASPIVQVPQVVTHPTAPALPMQYRRSSLNDPPPSYSEVVSSSPGYLSGMGSPYHQKDNIVQYPMASYPQTYDMTGSSSYSSRPFIQTQGRRSPYDSPLLSPATASGRASPSAYHDGYIPLRETLDRTSPHGSMHFLERTSPHRTPSRGTSPGRASPYYPAGGSLNRSSPHGSMHFPGRTSPHRTSPREMPPFIISPARTSREGISK